MLYVSDAPFSKPQLRRPAANGDRRAVGRFADGICRLVRADAAVSVSDPRGVTGDLYRRAVLRLSVA